MGMRKVQQINVCCLFGNRCVCDEVLWIYYLVIFYYFEMYVVVGGVFGVVDFGQYLVVFDQVIDFDQVFLVMGI